MPRPRSALLFCLSLCSLALLVSVSLSSRPFLDVVSPSAAGKDNADLGRSQRIHQYGHPHLDRRQGNGNGTDASPTASGGGAGGGGSASTPVDTAIPTGTGTTAVDVPDTDTSVTSIITQTTLPTSESNTGSPTATTPTASNSGTAPSSGTSPSTALSSAAASTGAATSLGTSAAASSTSGASSAATDGVSTVIVTTTAADGSVITSASLSTAPAQTQSAGNNGDDEPSNSKKWIIPLSVIGGIIVLAGVLFIAYRCTQRRFSDLDDDGATGIRWPELLKRGDDYESAATLNPLGTKRRDGAAGIGFEMDETKGMSSTSLNENANGNGNGAAEHFAAAGLGSAGMAINRSASSAGTTSPGYGGGGGYSDQGHGGGMGGAYYAGPQPGYYDPYLGVSGAPYPPPQRIMSPANAGTPYYDPYAQQQQGPPHAQPPYYPPRSVSPFAAAGAGQGQGQGGSGSGPGSRSGTPPAGMPGYRPPSVPLEQHQQHAYQDQQTESLNSAGPPQQQQGVYEPASPTQSQLGAGGQQGPVGNRGLMRLSIANPEE